jgi:hypothetical protein
VIYEQFKDTTTLERLTVSRLTTQTKYAMQSRQMREMKAVNLILMRNLNNMSYTGKQQTRECLASN